MHAEMLIENFEALASAPGGVDCLRELILDLGVSGRLSHRNGADQPAAELVAKVAGAIKTKATNGSIRRPRFFGRPALQPNSSALPVGWVLTTLGSLGLISPRNELDDEAAAGFVPMAAIDAAYGRPHLFDERDWSNIKNGFTHVADGDVVLAKITPCFENKKSAVIRGLPSGVGAGTTELHVFRQITEVLEPKYLLAFLKSGSFIRNGIPKMTGTAGQKRIPVEYFALCPFPLPPLAEQRRIVAKVDELMALCDRLETQQAERSLLKRAAVTAALNDQNNAEVQAQVLTAWGLTEQDFHTLYDDHLTVASLRAALLGLAMQGKFHTQDDVDEPALQSLEKAGRVPLKSRSRQREPAGQQVSRSEQPFEIPKAWQWVQLGALCELVTSGSRDWAKYYSDSGAAFVRMGNLSKGHYRMRLDSIQRVTPPADGEGSRTSLQADDILISITGDVGMLGLVPEDFGEAYINQHTALVRLFPELRGRFFAEFFRSPLAQQQFNAPQRGIKNSFRLTDITQLLVPLPPLPEQQRIVAKIDQLMGLCDKLDARVADSERLSSELFASIISEFTNPDPNGGRDVEAIAEERHELETEDQSQPPPTVGDLKPEALSVPTAAPVDTKLQEAALVGAIVKSFFADGGEPIGNFRLQKAVYFARRHNADPSATADFLKKAAGPYNPSMKYSGGIAIAKAKNYITEARGRYGFGHIPGATIAELDTAVEQYGYRESATWVNQHFKFKKNEEWELLATVDYAMLQLRDATPGDILAYVANDPEWRPKIEKLGLTEFKIETAMLEIRALFPNSSKAA